MAQFGAHLVAVNQTFERGCKRELGSLGSEGRGKAVRDCTPESLTTCFLRKKELCWPSAPVSLFPGAHTCAQEWEEAGGRGGLHFWKESCCLQAKFLVLSRGLQSIADSNWEVRGQLPLCSYKGYHLTYLRSRRRVIDVFSAAWTASSVPMENGE